MSSSHVTQVEINEVMSSCHVTQVETNEVMSSSHVTQVETNEVMSSCHVIQEIGIWLCFQGISHSFTPIIWKPMRG